MLLSLGGEFGRSRGQTGGDVQRRGGADTRMKVVGEALVDIGRGADVADEEVEENGTDHTALRHPHLDLPPSTGLALVHYSDTSVPEVGDEPTLEICMEIGMRDFLD